MDKTLSGPLIMNRPPATLPKGILSSKISTEASKNCAFKCQLSEGEFRGYINLIPAHAAHDQVGIERSRKVLNVSAFSEVRPDVQRRSF